MLKWLQAHVTANSETLPLELEIVDPITVPELMSFETLEGNPTYYATKDPSTLPESLQKLQASVKEVSVLPIGLLSQSCRFLCVTVFTPRWR